MHSIPAGMDVSGLLPPEDAMPTIFAICYRPGPAWIPGKRVFEQPLRPHLAYMKSLYDAGHIVLGGPYADDTGGLVAIEADSHEVALDLAMGDPAIASGIMLADVHPWTIVGSRVAKADATLWFGQQTDTRRDGRARPQTLAADQAPPAAATTIA